MVASVRTSRVSRMEPLEPRELLAAVAVADLYMVEFDGLLLDLAGVMANDLDAAGESVALVDGTEHGRLVLDKSGAFAYAPDIGFRGVDSFFYSLGNGSQAEVTLVVGNRAPEAADDAYTVDPDTPLVIVAPGPLGNDVDPDGDALTFDVTRKPDAGQVLGYHTGWFAWVPPTPDFTGIVTFEYAATDVWGQSDTATVSITVGQQQPETVIREYTILNTGTAPLEISGVTITGEHAADFSVVQEPAAEVLPGGSTVFAVEFAPLDVGLRTATVSVYNNDPDEAVYDFAIQGEGVAADNANLDFVGPRAPTDFGAMVATEKLKADAGNALGGEVIAEATHDAERFHRRHRARPHRLDGDG